MSTGLRTIQIALCLTFSTKNIIYEYKIRLVWILISESLFCFFFFANGYYFTYLIYYVILYIKGRKLLWITSDCFINLGFFFCKSETAFIYKLCQLSTNCHFLYFSIKWIYWVTFHFFCCCIYVGFLCKLL